MSVIQGGPVGQKPDFSCPLLAHSTCQREDYTASAQKRQSTAFPTFRWKPSCRYSRPGKPLRIGTEESNRYCCSYRLFPNIGGALIKTFATRRERSIRAVRKLRNTSKTPPARYFVFQREARQHIKQLTKPWIKREYFIHSCQG